MKKVAIGFLLGGIAAISLHAQTTEFQLERAVRTFNEQKAYAKAIPGKPADSQLVRVEGFWWAAKPLLQEVQSRGTDAEKQVARYFRTLLQYEIAFTLGRRNMSKSTLDRMLSIEADMNYYADSTLFPLRYKFDNKTYAIKYNNFAPTYAEFVVGLGELLLEHKRNTDAVARFEKGYTNPYSTRWIRYVVCDKLSRVYRKRTPPDSANAYTWNKRALDEIEKMERSNWKTIREQKYNGPSFFADQLEWYISSRLPLELDGYPLARAAILLEEWGDSTQLIKKVYQTSFAAGNRTPAHLQAAIRYAEKNRDAASARTYRSWLSVPAVTAPTPQLTTRNPATASVAKPPVSSPTQVSDSPSPMSLEAALVYVTERVQRGKASFLSLKGREGVSKRYSGTVYTTPKLTTAAVEEFMTGISTGTQDNYYWYAWLGEDNDTQFKGRLLAVYQNAQQALLRAFPKASFKNLYNKWNYYEVDLGQYGVVNLSYYFNSNTGKENVLLYIRATYQK